MRARAQHVALQHFSSVSSLSYGLAAILASRSLGCDGGAITDEKQGLCLADGGPARRDVTLGTAEVCLPTHLLAGRLSEGTRLFETDGKSGTLKECKKKIKVKNLKGSMAKQMEKQSSPPGNIFGARRQEDESRAIVNSEVVDCKKLNSQISEPKSQEIREKAQPTPDISGSKTTIAWFVDALSPWSKPEESTPSIVVLRHTGNSSSEILPSPLSKPLQRSGIIS
jgi:hypothetical protein